MRHVFPLQLAARLADPGQPPPLLLDVRETWEFDLCHIDGSVHMPVQKVPLRFQELDPARETVVICHHSMRSQRVAAFLEHRGFTAVCYLFGGIHAWAVDADPAMRRY